MSMMDNDPISRLREVARQNGCKITFGRTGMEPTAEEYGQWHDVYVSDLIKGPHEIGKDELDEKDDLDVMKGKPYYLVQLMNSKFKLPILMYARSENGGNPFVYAQYDDSIIKLFELRYADIEGALIIRTENVTYTYAPIERCRDAEMNERLYSKPIHKGPLKGHQKLLMHQGYDEWKALVAPFERVSMAENGVAIARRCLGGINDRSFTDPRNMESIAAAAECLRKLGGLPKDRRNSWRDAASVVMSEIPELPRGLARSFLNETVRLFEEVNLSNGRQEKAALLAFLLNQGGPKEKWTFNEILGIADRYF